MSRKLINNRKEISIAELYDIIINGSKNTIVYYRSSDKRDSAPVFLKKSNMNTWGFLSPYTNKSTPSFSNSNLVTCLELVVAARNVYILFEDEINDLFKLQKD